MECASEEIFKEGVMKRITDSQIIKPIILLYTTFMSMKMQARMRYYNEWSELIPKKVSKCCSAGH